MFNHEACVILLELREAFDYLFGVLPALKDLNVPVHYLEFFFLLVHFLLQRSLEVDIASFLLLTLLRNRWKQAIVKPERSLFVEREIGLEACTLLRNVQVRLNKQALQVPDVLLLRPKSIPLLQKARDDRVVLLGALFGNLSILLLDKLDCVLVHEGLYISQQRVVLTLNKRDSLLEHSI